MGPEINMDLAGNVAEIEIAYRPLIKASQRPKIKSSQDAYGILLGTWDKNKLELQEQFRMVLLNCGGGVLGLVTLSDGKMNEAYVDRRLLFGTALKAAAAGIIVAHNHPSGSLKPSKSDEVLTRLLKAGGEILGVKLQDHIIVTADGYFSFLDSGLL